MSTGNRDVLELGEACAKELLAALCFDPDLTDEQLAGAYDELIRGFVAGVAQVHTFSGTMYCSQCNELCSDYYMVRDDVWLQVMPTDAGYLHLVCLEKRLGRRLSGPDFPLCPINDFVHFLLLRQP